MIKQKSFFLSMKNFKLQKKVLRAKPVIRNDAKSYFGDIKQFLVSPYSFFQVKSIEKQNKRIVSFTLNMIIISFCDKFYLAILSNKQKTLIFNKDP